MSTSSYKLRNENVDTKPRIMSLNTLFQGALSVSNKCKYLENKILNMKHTGLYRPHATLKNARVSAVSRLHRGSK